VSLSQASYVLADRYRLDDRIAKGGMGEVWRAFDLVLGRPVAVKLLRDDYAQHPETLERFRAEARHTAAVSHPGIAQMYDYGEPCPGQPPFLVMELVDGVPLTELVARGPLDPARVMDLVAQTAAGLSAAHAVGLVHRDIKPGNLLVSPDGTVKITDFGIAYAAGSAPLTRTGALIGTPAYLAPERVTGASAGPASDLYSLGIVAYECLTGAQPFTGTPMEVALSHQYQSLPPLPPAVPLPVAALVAELTARDPAGRPADAGEVAARTARLRDAMDGAATQAEPWLATPAAEGDIRYGALPAARPGRPGETHPEGATLREIGLHDAAMYGLEPPGPRGARRRARRHAARGHILLVLAAAAVAVIVVLTGWMLVSGASGAPPAPHHPAAARHSARPTTAAAPTVTVNAGALVGQPYKDVVRQLQQLGLKVRATFVPSGQDHGTVLSVSPHGEVRIGSTVTVTVAAHQTHHHHDGGDGNGNGGGQ
jgi:hypothetical protein